MSQRILKKHVLCSVGQSCPTLCNPRDYSPPGSSVHGILQAGILEWVAISPFRGSSGPRDQTQISWVSCVGETFFTKEQVGEFKWILPLFQSWMGKWPIKREIQAVAGGEGEPVVLEVVAGRGGCRLWARMLAKPGLCKARMRLAIKWSATGRNIIGLCEGAVLTFQASLQKSFSCWQAERKCKCWEKLSELRARSLKWARSNLGCVKTQCA